MTVRTACGLTVADLQDLLRRADPAALLIPPRILRRVIKRDRGLSGFGLQVPHRKSYVIGRDALLAIAGRKELGLSPDQALPDTVSLFPLPNPRSLRKLPRDALLLKYWRLLFHTHVHVALSRRAAEGRLTDAAVRERVRLIGTTEFEEARSVIGQEGFLLPPGDLLTTYEEFAALYLELRHFDPRRLGAYFPSLSCYEEVDRVLAEDLDAGALLAATRLEGAPEPDRSVAADTVLPPSPPPRGRGVGGEGEDSVYSAPSPPAPLPRGGGEGSDSLRRVEEIPDAARAPDERQFQRLTAKAAAAEAKGNVVRAAIFRRRAADGATPPQAEAATADARSALERLLSRLQAALDLPPGGLDTWRAALLALLEPASRGLWPVEARLLYDLQKVCIDHEREIYALDLVEWFVSWGRRPVKRLLPNQGQVLTVKHLRVAARRLPRVRLPDELRRPFVGVLLAAIARSEERLRHLLRPAALQALEDVGLRPESVPEAVARDKLVEELLDRVVERDFLQMGDLRDAVARNRLKLPDLAGPGEFFVGDRLIRANRRLAATMDGVYRRGEIYLRWLQRLSSLAFGTRVGRFLTRYVVLPVGGAFVGLEGLGHLLHMTGLGHLIREFLGLRAEQLTLGASAVGLGASAPGVGPLSVTAALLGDTTHKVHLVNRYSLPLTALFLLGLLYFPAFRHAVVEILRHAWLVVRGVCYDLPRFVLHLPIVRLVVNSRPYLFLYHYALKPVAWAAPVSLGLLLAGVDQGVAFGMGGGVFLAVALLVNSRLGMQVEEALSDRVARAWRLLRFDLIPGLFRLVLFVFRRLVEDVEKFLYAVDELLRFKSGDSRLSLLVKPVLGLTWFFLTYLIRVVINLFVEPTFNPIKHFPVVTVAAKMLLPFLPLLERLLRGPLEPLVGVWLARLLAVAALFLLPGLAGFLVWELKENWKLYRANQSQTLDPVVVGSHGETVLRLLRPGLHSGTLPKLYARLRRARGAAARKQRAALHHVGEGVRHFVARELLAYLAVSKRWGVPAPEVRAVHLGCKRIRTELACPAVADDCLAFDLEEHGGRLVAGVAQAGWTDGLDADQANALADALAGFYKLAGVDLVREQLADGLPAGSAYDVVEEGLLVWAGPGYESGALYDLNGGEELAARRLAGTPPAKFRKLKAVRVLFRETPVFWAGWVAQWDADAAGKGPRHKLLRGVRVLPGR